MTPEQQQRHEAILADLRQHEDYRRVVIGGREREFCLGLYGTTLAKERGVDILDDTLGGFDSVVAHVYAGVLPFEPDLAYEDLAHRLSLKDVMRLQPLTRVMEPSENGAGRPPAEGPPPKAAAPGGEGKAVPARA